MMLTHIKNSSPLFSLCSNDDTSEDHRIRPLSLFEITSKDAPSPGGIQQLGSDFEPGHYDVICGRGKQAFFHSGNKIFRKLVEKMAFKYASAPSKAVRSCIVSDIIDKIRSLGNGFVKQENDGTWVEVGDALAREKVGALFRNALSNQYKSSTEAKKRHRNDGASKMEAALHIVMINNRDIQEATQSMASFASIPNISEDDVLSYFTARNSFLLNHVIKRNSDLFQDFQRTAQEFGGNVVNSCEEEN